jgi:hypothetical protein
MNDWRGSMTINKKPKAVWVCSTPVTPVTAKERRRINRRIRAHHERLRRKYKEVHGKKVDWISHAVEDGCMYFTVRFTDKTAFHLQVTPELLIEGIELSDWSSGDDRILRTYYRPQGQN